MQAKQTAMLIGMDVLGVILLALVIVLMLSGCGTLLGRPAAKTELHGAASDSVTSASLSGSFAASARLVITRSTTKDGVTTSTIDASYNNDATNHALDVGNELGGAAILGTGGAAVAGVPGAVAGAGAGALLGNAIGGDK